MKHIDNIDILISKYLQGEATPDEAISLEEWKSKSDDNLEYFLSFEKTNTMLNQTNGVNIDTQKAWRKVSRKTTKQNYALRVIMSIAATVTILLMCVFLFNGDAESVIYNASGSELIANLADGSVVNLDNGSTLELHDGFNVNNRKMKLSGKGTFSVTHSENKPFIIDLENVWVEDLGTIFSVESYPDSDTIFVIVKEGIVRLYDQYGSELIIKAGEKAWYIKSQKLLITDINAKVLKFDFKETKLTDIVSILDDSFNDIVKLMPESIGRCKVTTQFFDEDIETIIAVLSETLDFEYEYHDGIFTIKGQPCN